VIAKLSIKGQLVVPEAVREQARLKQGDELDVGYADGLIVMRKRVPLNPARVRKLLLHSNRMPAITPDDEAAVARAIGRVRRQRKS
jgi:AbrB family looped-hinge helix DNA binding protein